MVLRLRIADKKQKAVYKMEKALNTLKKYGKTICGNVFLLEDGTIKEGRKCSFMEKLTAKYFYKFIDNTIYKL
jgi:hypothetical protein